MSAGAYRCGHPKPENPDPKHGCKICRREREKQHRIRKRGGLVETPFERRSAEAWMKANEVLLRTAYATGSSIEFLMSDCRWDEVIRPRQAAMLVMRRCGMTYPKIGLLFGRDHSTVISGCRRAEQREAAEPAYAALIAKISL